MLNASVGVQRVMGRLRRPRSLGPDHATALQTRSLAAARRVRIGWESAAAVAQLTPTHDRRMMGHAVRRQAVGVVAGISPDRIVALTVAAIVLVASVLSVSGGAFTKSTRPIGGTDGGGSAPRLAVGGAAGIDRDDWGASAESETGGTGAVEQGSPIDVDSPGVRPEIAEEDLGSVSGPYLEDGTLLKPVAVDTTVEDGSDLLRTYKVKSGDTLTGIARKFKVSMMTLWWANSLDSKDELRQGQVLSIPPVSGLVVTVSSNDTLDGLAAKHNVKTKEILDANGLDDPNLVVGQVLVIPGARGKPIPTPKPTRKPTVTTPRNTGGGAGGGSGGGPAQYSGGQFAWPVSGGNNYISQYYQYGHLGLDIAADYASRVRSAADGTVLFAGWKSNGGGYQVWVSHGSGLYTTYNHMSGVSVGSGQRISKGQQVGRIGQSGNATGPHLHFEVWKGPIWDGGQRVNPLGYL